MPKSEAKGGKSKRRLRNLLISPRGQLRLIFAAPIAAMLCVCVWLATLRHFALERVATMAPGPDLADLEAYLDSSFLLGMSVCLFFGLLLGFGGLIISHRFYGPLVAIRRTLRAFCIGEYQDRVRLRPHDELHDVAAAVNDLGEALIARHGQTGAEYSGSVSV